MKIKDLKGDTEYADLQGHRLWLVDTKPGWRLVNSTSTMLDAEPWEPYSEVGTRFRDGKEIPYRVNPGLRVWWLDEEGGRTKPGLISPQQIQCTWEDYLQQTSGARAYTQTVDRSAEVWRQLAKQVGVEGFSLDMSSLTVSMPLNAFDAILARLS
jgi:hypothetical protein